ncbi:MAG: 50S ribosomal protein L25 [Candidatus Sumerlaeota bacterium]|nr:50S ribosomal protein L25 [Candidatus Sumerlaeota bacterium]
MAEQEMLNAQPRTEHGKGPARRLRAQGLIPAILYGAGEAPVDLALPQKEIERLLAIDRVHTIINLRLAGADGAQEQQVMFRELQRDPVTRRPVHADLIRVRADQELHVTVEVHGAGTPTGVREGGILERPVREVEIRCLPADLPEHLEVDISGLKINGSFHARELPLGGSMHLVTDPETVLFHVAIPRAAAAVEAEKEAAEGEEAEEGEPEVIGKKKAEEAES